MAEGLGIHYRAVLDDLQQRKQAYKDSIVELDRIIASMLQQLEAVAPSGSDFPAPGNDEPVVLGEYSDMSVRWAILKLLGEDTHNPMATGDVATALEKGGVTTRGQRFASIVSAVLSDMKNKKQEVETADDGMYRLSENGRQAWEAIKNSVRYQDRPSASAP